VGVHSHARKTVRNRWTLLRPSRATDLWKSDRFAHARGPGCGSISFGCTASSPSRKAAPSGHRSASLRGSARFARSGLALGLRAR
jgi:hypothetical protein